MESRSYEHHRDPRPKNPCGPNACRGEDAEACCPMPPDPRDVARRAAAVLRARADNLEALADSLPNILHNGAAVAIREMIDAIMRRY